MKKRKPTAAQFLRVYPHSPRNDNCLEDIACPKCGQREQFKVRIITMGELTDDGTDAEVGDHEWGNYIECSRCAHYGNLAGFTFKGLDELISRAEQIL